VLLVRSRNQAALRAGLRTCQSAPRRTARRGRQLLVARRPCGRSASSATGGLRGDHPMQAGLAPSSASAAVRSRARCRAARCRRKLPAASVLARPSLPRRHTKRCPILGAGWERRDSVRRGQKGSPCPAGLV
jgi:hypothetical protein